MVHSSRGEQRFIRLQVARTIPSYATLPTRFWGIKSMHWVLDVKMKEDEYQIYKDNGAENLSCLRHIRLNVLRSMPDYAVW